MKIQSKITLFAVSAALGLMPLMIANAQSNAPSAQPWYNCRTREVWTLQKQAWCQKAERVKNTTYQLPNVGSVQLRNGFYQDQAKAVTVTLVDKPGFITFADLNNDGNEDAVAMLTVNEETAYLSSVLNIASNPRPVEAVLLGDRIQVQSIVVNAGQIQVNVTKNDPPQAVMQTYTMQGNTLALVSECLIATNERDNYSAINLEQINSDLTGSNPREIAIAAFGIQEPQEGNFQQTVTVDDGDRQQVVTITQNNLPDDSVRDVRYRVEFEPVAQRSQWRMVWAGRQQRCQQGRGSQDWTTEACL